MTEYIRTEEELLRMYIGPNTEDYINLHRKLLKDGYLAMSGGNISAFLFTPLPWAWYRKQYAFGVGLISLLMGISYIASDFASSFMGLFFLIALPAFYVNNYYIWNACRQIKKMESLSLTENERDDLIRKAGGTSILGAVIASIPILFFLAAFVVTKLTNIE